MERIAFVTDSTACLTPQQIADYQVTVVPLSVIFGGEVFREGIDLATDEFYPMMAASKAMPTTSQPPVGEFVEVFERLLKHHDTILCLLLSSKLSGTYQSAQTAAHLIGGENIVVVDSKIASYGISGPLIDGVKLARRGATAVQVLKLWEDEIAASTALLVVDTLEYLHRGGRIGGAAAMLGALLQIKPILTMRDGTLDVFEKVRTHRRAMERILAVLDARANSGAPLQVGVVHSSRLQDALKLRDEIAAKYPNVRADVGELGPVIGTHTGPGLLAIFSYPRLLEDE